MKIVSIIGNRPQYIKLAGLCDALTHLSDIQHFIINTGQHFDFNMSSSFLRELGIPPPHFSPKTQFSTVPNDKAEIVTDIKTYLKKIAPDWVLVFGDTNSTLLGAEAAKLAGFPLAHIEAGLRSDDLRMREEHNRIQVDDWSDICFCPTPNSFKNLKEQYPDAKYIVLVGDIMLDVWKKFKPKFMPPDFNLPPSFTLCTLHRAETVDNPALLQSVFDQIKTIKNLLLLVHPRTKEQIDRSNIYTYDLQLIPPQPYLTTQYLLQQCSNVITDSGGLQKEAFWHRKKTLVLRTTTEWVELLTSNASLLCDPASENIETKWKELEKLKPDWNSNPFGEGNTGALIIDYLQRHV